MHFLQLGIFLICVAVSITVGILLICLLIAHRASENSATKSRQSIGGEIIWAVIPCLIIILLISPASITFMHQTM